MIKVMVHNPPMDNNQDMLNLSQVWPHQEDIKSLQIQLICIL
jgi:hypothetical protein